MHGGASGIGTHAIQVARALGARVAVTAGSAAKLEICRDLGAEITINYRDEDFVARLRKETKGADVIFDIMGASYLDRNIDALATDGQLVIIGMQGGVQGELNIGKLVAKRARVIGTTLRGRPVSGPNSKSEIVQAVTASVWPMIADGRVREIIGARMPIERAPTSLTPSTSSAREPSLEMASIPLSDKRWTTRSAGTSCRAKLTTGIRASGQPITITSGSDRNDTIR
jgi:NADPH2:quinone reductase